VKLANTALEECTPAGSVETFTAWVDGASFTYAGAGRTGVRLARNTWSVEPAGAAQTILRSEAHVELNGAIRARILRRDALAGPPRCGTQPGRVLDMCLRRA
jgi:hypothetical protein